MLICIRATLTSTSRKKSALSSSAPLANTQKRFLVNCRVGSVHMAAGWRGWVGHLKDGSETPRAWLGHILSILFSIADCEHLHTFYMCFIQTFFLGGIFEFLRIK